MELKYIVGIIYLVSNGIAFLLVGLDKLKAKMSWYRISEKALLVSSFLMGAIGVSTGMITFHHKVSKKLFRTLVPLSMLLNIAVAVAMVYYGVLK